MISNERQYQVTKAQAAKFRQALEELMDQPPAGLPPKALKALRVRLMASLTPE